MPGAMGLQSPAERLRGVLSRLLAPFASRAPWCMRDHAERLFAGLQAQVIVRPCSPAGRSILRSLWKVLHVAALLHRAAASGAELSICRWRRWCAVSAIAPSAA
jgi:hypothetical protein